MIGIWAKVTCCPPVITVSVHRTVHQGQTPKLLPVNLLPLLSRLEQYPQMHMAALAASAWGSAVAEGYETRSQTLVSRCPVAQPWPRNSRARMRVHAGPLRKATGLIRVHLRLQDPYPCRAELEVCASLGFGCLAWRCSTAQHRGWLTQLTEHGHIGGFESAVCVRCDPTGIYGSELELRQFDSVPEL